MNREKIIDAFQALIHTSYKGPGDPMLIARRLCREVGVPAASTAHAAREIVNVMADGVRTGNASEEAVSNAIADWLLDFAAASE